MSGWSEISLRARATTVIPSAVMYKAHTVLTRGRSTLEKGYLWIKGQSDNIIRYVDAPAYSAHASHLASGWQQDHHKAASMLLGSYELPAYMGHKPYFWTSAAPGWESMPDSVAGTPAIVFWRDICASMCFRRHDDDVEMMQVDLRPGLYEGFQTHVRSSRCDCYAYDDMAKLNATGDATAEPGVSHEAPNDLAMARFLSTATLVNNYVGTRAGVDEGLRYRRFINTYAVHRDAWNEFFVVEEQSTVFHKLALEPGYHFEGGKALGMDYKEVSGVTEIGACMRECAMDYENRMDFATMVFVEDEPGPNCWCVAKDLLLPEYDDRIVHDPSNDGRKIKVYRTKLCVGVAGGSERSVVYRKGVKGANAVCTGMPVGSGMILANGSTFLSKDAADDTRPIDIQCRSACDANPDCAMAHSFVSARTARTPARARAPRPSPVSRLCCRAGRDLQRAADGARAAASARPARAAHATAAARPSSAAHAARAAARWHRRPAHVVARHVQLSARGSRRRLQRLLLHVLRFWTQLRRKRRHHLDGIPRAVPQVGLADIHPDDGAPHDRPGHVPFQRVSL
jgi:hypothetical protein